MGPCRAVVRLLAYISDKDLFAEFYRKKLSRRLLFDKSANDDHERQGRPYTTLRLFGCILSTFWGMRGMCWVGFH